jgi:CIC family chloride channel protein
VTGVGFVLVVLLGLLCGVLGLAYNWSVLAGLDLMARAQRRVAPELLAGAVGVVVVLVGLVSPRAIGGGDSVSQAMLDGSVTFRALLVLLVAWWLLGAVVAGVAEAVLPGSAPAAALPVIGMVAFFTAVVRAPVCGVVLIAEMTGTTSLLVPGALAAAAATLVCLARGGQPIYDSLRQRTLAADATRAADVARAA